MAQTINGISRSKVISNLDTYNHTALQNSMYVVEVKMNETITGSAVMIDIQQNGVSKSLVGPPISIRKGLNNRIILNCAASDLISVVVSSSALPDSGPNSIKGILNIRIGSV